jgi:fructose-1,6-bisphosphatase/sedoheptulose 1,7-bisphosphatase-like protein
MSDDKRTACVKVYVSEPLELELRRLAEADDRKLSDYIAVILRRHVFGHVALTAGDQQGPDRPT